ncbi:HD domain-containing protein [Sulfurovum sp. AR]|uniref:HD domain-containing protein n=1 Tax=Sulfurovum sp. AR TaxID=1165841 RepID=UPI00025C47D1|nr:HD domain-containing protein [Sulfurovum sp. AR]EIF50719.1 metal dependent phosphohydrolase [Sulfurovum sp. AR]
MQSNSQRSMLTTQLSPKALQTVEECELGIVGHKVFVRLKDIPMYLSKRTKDSIRNRYSHSMEVGLSTEYILNHLSRQLGNDVDLNFFKIGKIVGLLHDIGHTAFSHDGETILDTMLQKASATLDSPLRFNANLNNFRRILKYEFYENLPEDVREYALASLVKRVHELEEYPEYLYLKQYVLNAIALEEKYLGSKGIMIQNITGKTILCQAMDLADENRYRVTDIIDSLNIYTKEKLQEILLRSIKSEVRVKDIRKLVYLKTLTVPGYESVHYDKMKIKELLIALLNRSSNAKTEFQNTMNAISMAFNRNFRLREDGKLVPVDDEIEALRKEFQKVAAKYLWGSKKVQNIKKPFSHYFTTVADYFINKEFDLELIDSNTYKEKLTELQMSNIGEEVYLREKLSLMRNFLGGLTNLKIMEIYKKISLLKFEAELGYQLDNRDKLVDKHTVEAFEKKLEKKRQRLLKKRSHV